MGRRLKKEWQSHVMLLPAVVIRFIFSYIPLFGLVIAFQNFNPGLGFISSPWVGFRNFERLFVQPNFIRTIWNTLFIASWKIATGIAVPVIFSLLLNEINNRFAKRVFQTLIYVPNFMSWVIIAGIMQEILAADGLLNRLLMMLGLEAVNFLGSAKIFPWTIIVSDIWKDFGFGTIVYLASISGIDPELYDSARVDGANRIRQLWHITLPLLKPIIILKMTLALGGVLNAGFDQIFNLYAPVVYETGDIIDTYVYRLGILSAQFSLSTAVGMFKSVVSSILICTSYYLAFKFSDYRIF